MQSDVPVVVLLGQLNGLGIIRSLGRGVGPIYVIDRDRLNPAMWSRYARPILSPVLHGEEIVNSLLKLQGTLGERPVLFNTHEMAVVTISKYRSSLAAAFRFRLPKHETVLTLQDKARFHELATTCGLPIPRGEIFQSSSEIARKLHLFRCRVVVKPADKGHVHAGKARNIIVFDRLEDAVTGCERMLEHTGEIIVQEWVDGANNEIYFCLFYRGRNGKIVSMFTGRKLASSPPGIGLTAYCVAAPEAREALEPMTEAFLERIDYSGMGSMEYKWDATNRRFVIIEPTVGRTDWQEEIATLSGVNIPLEAYCHELEIPLVPRMSPCKKVVWRASFLERLKTERPSLPAAAIVYDGYWRLDDPMPAIVQYSCGTMAAVGRELRKRIQRIAGLRSTQDSRENRAHV
jgi:predicted ATP-grasp superfamily ATP-dependent carboligase